MNMRFRHLGLLLLLTGLFWYAPGTALATGADVVDTLYYNGVIRPMTESPREAADMRAAMLWKSWPCATGRFSLPERRRKPGTGDIFRLPAVFLI